MVMLLSGTLAHITQKGDSFDAINADLNIPPERCDAVTPLHPQWIYNTPTLYTPSPEIFHEYMPPSVTENPSVDEAAMHLWLLNCAKAINHATQTAAGGTLVLMTSFDRLEGLSATIRQHYPELAPRLIEQHRHERIGRSKEAFRHRAMDGQKPIWLATGAAWTGLDLRDTRIPDEQASEDVLLTDLVMPNLPFGLDRTTTHQARTERIGFVAEIIGVQRRMRQGLGRLVRREGLKHRRIWILDGRLQHAASRQWAADLHRALSLYLHQRTFKV